MNKILAIVIFVFVAGLTMGSGYVQAMGFIHLRGINFPLVDDYEIVSSNNEVTLRILAGSTKGQLTLKMMTLVSKERIGNFFTVPSGKIPATDLYAIRFTPNNTDNFTNTPELTINYEPDGYYKEAYFYDWTEMKFVKLESIRDELNSRLTVKLPERKKIMIALFNEEDLIGKASWYVYPKYAGELIAASRDFASGTQVKVTNLYNNKEVVVTIRDFGPKKCSDWTDKEQEQMGPCQERILDLSKTAFLKLATTTGVGIISNIKVTPVK